MQRENPLPFLFVLFGLFLLSEGSTAQTFTKSNAPLPPAEVLSREVERIEELTKFGPHYKNPNAAGRLLILNRVVPSLPSNHTSRQLFGPAYKNRQSAFRSVDSAVIRRSAKPRLRGPRYKNRGAKSGNF